MILHILKKATNQEMIKLLNGQNGCINTCASQAIITNFIASVSETFDSKGNKLQERVWVLKDRLLRKAKSDSV